MQGKKEKFTGIFGGVQDTFGQFFEGGAMRPVSFQAMFDAQKKNFEAITQANQKVLEGWQALTQRQSEMFSQFMQDSASNICPPSIQRKEDSPARFADQASRMASAYEKSLMNSQELAGLMIQCTKDAADLIHQRVIASLEEIKASHKE